MGEELGGCWAGLESNLRTMSEWHVLYEIDEYITVSNRALSPRTVDAYPLSFDCVVDLYRF